MRPFRTSRKLILLNILDMEYRVLPVARRGQKATEAPLASYGLACQPFSHGAKGLCLDQCLHIAQLTGFDLLGTVLQAQFDGRDASWREPQGRSLCDARRQQYVVLHSP